MTPEQLKIKIDAKRQAIRCIFNIFETQRETMPLSMLTELHEELKGHRAELITLETERLNG